MADEGRTRCADRARGEASRAVATERCVETAAGLEALIGRVVEANYAIHSMPQKCETATRVVRPRAQRSARNNKVYDGLRWPTTLHTPEPRRRVAREKPIKFEQLAVRH